MNKVLRWPFRMCSPREGTHLLKRKSNSDNPFPYGCCLPLRFSLMYYNSIQCFNSFHGPCFTSVFISALNIFPIHRPRHPFKFLFFLNFRLNIAFCGSPSLWTPVVVLNISANSLSVLLLRVASKFPSFKSECFVTALTNRRQWKWHYVTCEFR